MKDNSKASEKVAKDSELAVDPEVALSIDEKLRLETATIAWSDLQRFFAAGKVIVVAAGTSLVEVAAQLHNDNKHTFQQWIDKNTVAAVSDEQAKHWFETDATLWAVVVSPWVLVQEPASAAEPGDKKLH